MSLLSLKEFRSISHISDQALLWLLENQVLPISLDNESGIMVDLSHVDTKKLMASLAEKHSQVDSEQFNEMVEVAGRIIRDEFDVIVGKAIANINSQSK